MGDVYWMICFLMTTPRRHCNDRLYLGGTDASLRHDHSFGFNLFMPFREHGASALVELLARALGLAIRVVDIEFEFQGPMDVLAECAGPKPADDEKFTASDVAVHVEDDCGRGGLVLVEVKLGEGGFTPCNGARSAANKRKDVCASTATFFDDPRACYLRWARLAQRDRRYWDIFDLTMDLPVA